MTSDQSLHRKSQLKLISTEIFLFGVGSIVQDVILPKTKPHVTEFCDRLTAISLIGENYNPSERYA